nr:DNA-directed DNA polymerase [Tanacetum cinerariifolium]
MVPNEVTDPALGFPNPASQCHTCGAKDYRTCEDVPNDVIKLMMFSYSLEGNAKVWYDKEPPNSILTWEDLVIKFVNQFFPPSKTTHLKNEISRFTQRFEETFEEACERFKEMLRACPHHGFTELDQIDTFYNGLNDNDQDSLNVATGGNLLSKTTREAFQIIENKSKVRYSRNKPNVSRTNTTSRENVSKTDDRIDKLAEQILTLVDIFAKKVVTPAPVKAVEESCVTCGGTHAYYNFPNTDSNQPSVCVATGTYNQVAPQNRASNYMAPPGFAPNQSSTSGTLPSNTIPNPKGEMKAITTRSGVAYEGPSIPTPKKVVERETEETTDKEQTNFQGSTAHIQPPVTPILEPDVPKTLPKPNLAYLSRLNDQKLREKATNQIEKFFQIFQDLHFDISFADALLLMPKFASAIKSLLTNKDKLFELAKIPLNENCSAMLLKIFLKKLGDPGKFLIPCDFPGMDVCHALADLGASINLMPLSIWKKLSLPELTLTRMTLDLADRSITRPKGVAEDVFVKVGKFHFPTDFVVVDFKADPRVPLILGRSFLRTDRALIDVYGEEITLRVNDEAVTFNLNQTMRYSSTYDDLLVNRIDIIDVAREEYAQEILEEIDADLKDESVSPKIDHVDCDPEGDIFLIEKLLNNDPFQLPPMDLKQGEVVKVKSSIKEPSELELSSHLEYAYLEGVDKLPVIISKDLKVDEKEALLKVLKSHKRSIAWKITDIKGIDPRFCTHKILMEEDYKAVVQSQRRVNPKIHEIIKKEVIKLLDAGMIYPISDSSWVSPIHCVLKKGEITVVKKENNELIPTRLVTGWRVCIDYRKLNDATRKDHFPLPFMDQMLERLAGNEFYCFLDRFFGYFQIPINPPDQENTTFTYPYGTFAYRRIPFGLYNAPGTFQRCMMAIFHDMIKKTMEVFMDDFSVFGDSFSSCLSHLDTMLQRNNSHDGYDCQQQFSFVYEQEPSYNQNYDDNYYPHESLSFPCCDNCEGSHETFQCQPMDQNVDFSGFDQIQTPQFFAIKHDQPENSIELFKKLLEDLKELAEYKESLENHSKVIVVSNSNEEKEEPSQNSDIRHLIRKECCIEVSEEQKQKMKDTMLELVEICRQKELLCIYDNVDDLIESALNSKLLSINSQRPNNEQHEVKNVVEQPDERGNYSIESLHNFRVVHKKNPNTTPETESDEIIKSGVEELVPILSENKVTLEDKREFDDDFEDIEYVEVSLPNLEIISIEEENVVHQEEENDVEEEEIDLEDISQIQDIDLREKLLSITRLISNIESLNDNLTPDLVLNTSVSILISEEFDNSLSDNFLPEFKTFCDHTEETRSDNTTTHANDSLPEYDSFCFEIEPDHERLINVLKNDIPDDSRDPLLEEADLFLAFDNLIPPGIENFANDSEGDIRFLEALLIDYSIPFPNNESPDSDFDNPSVPLPPPKPPDADFELDFTNEISVVMNKFKCLRDEFNDSFMFAKVFSFLFDENEDTIFNPGISV